uniref:Transposase n=1 Tax=Candidatus Kentrum sp. TC TaxID=2126339 RepID=A0A450Z2I4_9GAMM|nr:MAG: Putative transposase [Candidatus Kentron sp. TC]
MPSSPRVRGLSFPFAKEQGFLPAVTVLHTFGSDLKRHVHIHFIVSSGGLKLSGKVERFTRYVKRKPKNRQDRKNRVVVLVDEPSWVRCSFFTSQSASKMLSTSSDRTLERENSQGAEFRYARPGSHGFSEPSTMKGSFEDRKKEYTNGFLSTSPQIKLCRAML